MAIGMPHMHFAYSPRHVGWRPCDIQTLIDASLVNGIDVVDPNRHPYTLVSTLIAVRAKRHPRVAFAAPALSSLTQEYFAMATADAAKRWRISPIPSLGPSQFLEPFETLLYVGNVQNGCQSYCIHPASLLFAGNVYSEYSHTAQILAIRTALTIRSPREISSLRRKSA
jgi:hypothetical protein